MGVLNKARGMMGTLVFVWTSCALYASSPVGIEVRVVGSEMKVGEPLIMEVTYRYSEPVISEETGQPHREIFHWAYLWVAGPNETNDGTRDQLQSPLTLRLQDEQGLEYAERFVLFHDFERGGAMFDEPGRYKIQVHGWTKRSNVLEIEVEAASELEERALSFLSGATDCHYLVSHEDKLGEDRKEIKERFRKVVEQCEGTLLSKWCAGRLGIDYFREFMKKHPSFVKTRALYKEGTLEDALFDKSCEYLELGSDLPDELPVREHILYDFSQAECVKGNYDKALMLIDEIGRKYPEGKYGRRAASQRAELEQFRDDELAETRQPEVEESSRRRLTAVLWPVGVGVMLVGLAVVLLLKGKAGRRRK